jgi:hypothetical protein
VAGASEYDLDDLLAEYLGPAGGSAEGRLAGLVRLRSDFEHEAESGKRMAFWLVLAMVGKPPAVGASFPERADRITARALAELLAVGRVGPRIRLPSIN